MLPLGILLTGLVITEAVMAVACALAYTSELCNYHNF